MVPLPDRPDHHGHDRRLTGHPEGANRAAQDDDWPDGLVSAREAFEKGLHGWPRPGEEPPPPPIAVPAGRGGEQRIPRPFNARPGGPPSWADVPPELRRPSLADVHAALAALGPAIPSVRERRLRAVPGAGDGAGSAQRSFARRDHRDGQDRRSVADWDMRPSAVLAPLYEADGQAVLVLTRRTWGLRTHQGEVSFPGGRIEPGESPVDAALREAKEEIDLDPSTVELIGELDHITTVSSRSFLSPYVGALPGRPECHPNPHEVEAVLHVPLAELTDPAVYREEIWTFPDGRDRSIYFFELVGDTLWGMTAALVRQLLGIVTHTLGRGDLGHP